MCTFRGRVIYDTSRALTMISLPFGLIERCCVSRDIGFLISRKDQLDTLGEMGFTYQMHPLRPFHLFPVLAFHNTL